MPTLTELLTECCDAIREKDGTTAPISPDDMATHIMAIPQGGLDVSRYSGIKFFGNTDTSIDLSTLDTSGFTDMDGMFQNCTRLTSIDVSGFDTSNATTITSMFSSATKLTSLDLSSFDTSNVTNMSSLVASASALTSLNLQSFTTQNATVMTSMLRGATALTDVIWAINSTNVEPMVSANAFDKVNNTMPTDLTIYVRTSLESAYKSATNWTRYSSIIKPISDLPQSLQELYNIDPNDYR